HQPRSKERQRSQDLCPTTPASPEGAGDTAVAQVPRGIKAQNSIAEGRYPLAGLSVAQARRVLDTTLGGIDPEAVAVIAGEVVEDEDAYIIRESVELVNFVKRASAKGTGRR
ncbi:MAG: hypothetical protein ACE5GW_07180, partial [Planctomycetota bacterium]